MKNKEQFYIIANKKTGKAKRILVNDWYIVPQFTLKKSAKQFLEESFDFCEDYKVIKVELTDL